MELEIIRSDRRTVGLEIRQGRLILRAPRRMTRREIDRFLQEHRQWIDRHMEKARQQQAVPKLTAEELQALAARAKVVIPQRVAHFAPLVGVEYGRITIRTQRTRWGSCSSKGNLNFNCLLMLAPPQVLDSVVVHELCHRKEMNHSARFYEQVLRVMPDYRQWDKWLKENGPSLMARLEE